MWGGKSIGGVAMRRREKAQASEGLPVPATRGSEGLAARETDPTLLLVANVRGLNPDEELRERLDELERSHRSTDEIRAAWGN